METTSHFSDMTSSLIFWRRFIPLVKFSYWFMFHVNITSGSGVITVSRNPEIGNTPEFCLTLGGWDELRILNLEGTSNNKMLLNAEKYQGYSFYLFWVIKGKTTWWVKLPPSPTQIKVKRIFKTVSHFFLLLLGFWEISKYLAPRAIVQSHFIRMFNLWIPTDNYKNADTVIIIVYLSSSWTTENFTAIM